MFLLSRLFLFLTKSAEPGKDEHEDAYLAEATVYDLEHRMRKLDHETATRSTTWLGNY
jgi:Protein of unknown function (DUF3563)